MWNRIRLSVDFKLIMNEQYIWYLLNSCWIFSFYELWPIEWNKSLMSYLMTGLLVAGIQIMIHHLKTS